jgi:hypothetical protein
VFNEATLSEMSINLNKTEGRTYASQRRIRMKFIIHIQKGVMLIGGEHKRNFHFQNDTENKSVLLQTSHLHQSAEKL